MLKSCKYCGGIHDRKYKCPHKPKRTNYKTTYIDKFRWSKVWQKKRNHIKERDKHLCQVCIRELHNTQLKYNFHNIEVHHIVPIAEDWNKRLDDDYLISLCKYHHELAECGEISREELLEIVKEQENVA
ncbi:HNH endonuclease [Lederbergia wuyishanensis]|uniref:Putative HNH nuclease YajD n=1 Tax=Lederbergia wuyishanensis TaxID=1347903 RepID=A0ABU0D4J8_9BACI|nr:HNH endonuclease [Lederbergia wuyishanensis]MCJ8008108.1 HNH endonuclease [Lederbergia wuyishanensis]MDQ0343306.1 5-methylcytosine-specific restriction endonuclease McrA [Lederbergia wuyishanensis]